MCAGRDDEEGKGEGVSGWVSARREHEEGWGKRGRGERGERVLGETTKRVGEGGWG